MTSKTVPANGREQRGAGPGEASEATVHPDGPLFGTAQAAVAGATNSPSPYPWDEPVEAGGDAEVSSEPDPHDELPESEELFEPAADRSELAGQDPIGGFKRLNETEGTAAAFTLTRTGATDAALAVTVSVTETGSVLDGTPATSVTIEAGSDSATLSVATEDDEVSEDASTLMATVTSGTGYTVIDLRAAVGAVTAWRILQRHPCYREAWLAASDRIARPEGEPVPMRSGAFRALLLAGASLAVLAGAPAHAQVAQEERVYRAEALAHARAVEGAWRRLESFILEESAGPTALGGGTPPAATGWQADWTARGLEAGYCEDTLLVWLAPARLKGTGADHRAVHAAPHAYGDGAVKAVPVERGQTSFLAALRESASGGAQALVVIAFEKAALTMVREAIDNGLYDRFLFGDAAKRQSLVRSIGGTRLGNIYGTGPAAAPESVSSDAWEAAYVEEHGTLPVLAYVKETYDATVVLALAAQSAGRLDGAAIRDRLRAVGGGPGMVVTAGSRGIADALRILAEGGEVDYEGASGSMDWDENGDLRRGHIGIWRFTEDERVEDVVAVPFRR